MFGKFQIQSRPTNTIFERKPGNGLPTPVLTNDAKNQVISWAGSVSPIGLDSWLLRISQTGLPGSFADYMNVESDLFTYSPIGDNVVGNFFLVIGVAEDGTTFLTNPSNVVQSSPTLQSTGDFDGPEIGWEWDNTIEPNFWSTYHYNGSGNIDDPANYTFLISTTGDQRAQDDSINHGDDYMIRGTANADGSSPVTPYSNHAHTFP